MPQSLSETQRALLFLLVVPLSVGSLHNGQCNPLILGLTLIALAMAARSHWNVAAIAVAIACSFKLYLIAIGLLLVLASPRKFGWRLAAALGVACAAPFLLQSLAYVTGQYSDWLQTLLTEDRSQWPLKDAYRDLWLLCRAWSLPLSRGVYVACQLLAAAGAAVLIVSGRRAGWPLPRLLEAALALGTCWIVLFGPATESATYIVLVPTLAWALIQACAEPWPKWQRGLVVIGFGILSAAAAAVWLPDAGRLHGLGLQPLGGVMLAVAVISRQVGHHGLRTTFGLGAWEACPAFAASHEFQ